MSAKAAPKETLQQFEKSKLRPRPRPPLEQLLLDAIGANVDPLEADDAVARMAEGFVNWNELRVARLPEIARLIDPLPEADKRAKNVREILNRLFDRHGAMELDFLADMKLTEGRKVLQEIYPAAPRQVLSIVLYAIVPGATLPISPEGLKAARKKGLIGRSGTKAQLQKALAADLEQEQAARMAHYLELEGVHGAGGAKKTTNKKAGKKTNRKTKST